MWTDLYPSGPGTPPALPLRHLILGALAEAFITRQDRVSGAVFCADCEPGRVCADHQADLAAAADYEAAYMRVRGIGSDGAMLAITGGLAS